MPITSCVVLGKGVVIHHPSLVNLYGCTIGAHTKIGTFVEIQKGVVIGELCKISSHTFICEGVYIGRGVFIGHNVSFINDKYPDALNAEGVLKGESDWLLSSTRVEDGVSIGTGAIIMCGISIGRNARIGAGAVVTKDVPAGGVVVGIPGKLKR